MRINASGNVGIGTNDPSAAKVQVVGDQLIVSAASGTGGLGLQVKGTALSAIPAAQVQGYIAVGDSAIGVSGDLLIAPRTSVVASIRFITGTTPAERLKIDASGHLTPGADNTQNFGSGALRWATVYAGSGSINTSDERRKVLREGGDLTEAEYQAWSNVRVIIYRDKDSFDRKGDAARLHVGFSWQAIKAAFDAQGLDASEYGLWCEDPILAPVEKTRPANRQAVETVEQPFEEVQIVDGAPVLVRGVRSVDQPVFDAVQVTDADTGEPVLIDGVALLASVPVMEGFIESYSEMEPTGETIGALRYQECSVLEAAWLRRELAQIEARVAALEA